MARRRSWQEYFHIQANLATSIVNDDWARFTDEISLHRPIKVAEGSFVGGILDRRSDGHAFFRRPSRSMPHVRPKTQSITSVAACGAHLSGRLRRPQYSQPKVSRSQRSRWDLWSLGSRKDASMSCLSGSGIAARRVSRCGWIVS
jgi:hypothetical protein